VPTGVLQSNSLKSDNIIHSGLDTTEETDLPETNDFGRDFARCLQKSPVFNALWMGGGVERHLSLRKQIDIDSSGRLLYNGRIYNKDTWCRYYFGDLQLYGPPKVIRQMGRVAKEIPNPANNNPEISILTQNGDVIRLDACPCGGELILDHRGALYCSNCFVVYE
jgi:hypothetical protein